jgi:hypothetical protein
MNDLIRLQVDILKHQLEELEELQHLGGLRSKRELWDTAFTLLKWASRKKAQGFSIGSMGEEGEFTELEMPFLEHYGTRARQTPSIRKRKITGLAQARNGKGGITKKRQLA